MLVVSGLFGGGGTERVVADLANRWADAGHDVIVVTISDVCSHEWPLNRSVRRIALGLLSDSRGPLSAMAANLRRILALRRTIRSRQPDRIISFGDRTNVTTLLAAAGSGVPVLVSERADPDRHPIGRAFAPIRRRTYPHAAAIVIPARAMEDALRRHVGTLPMTVIPNAVPAWTRRASLPNTVSRQAEPTGPTSSGPTLVAVGRLVPDKGFDLLLEAMPTVLARSGPARLIVAGEGPERPRLEAMASVLPPGTVELPGFVEGVASLIGSADVFVLSSRTEGMPNALLEAMAAGVACVSFDCPTGPSEIIRDGVNGRLVPPENVPALAEAICEFLTDGSLRRRLADAASGAVERFAPEAVDAAWDAALGWSRR